MRVAVLSESPADEAAVRILVESILSKQTQSIALPPLKTRGWSPVFIVLPTVLRHLHYQTVAEVLVVVLDSDESPVHQSAHEQPGGTNPQCRLCRLREDIRQIQHQLRPVSGRAPIKTALGLAVPAMEAWYRCGLDPHVTEAAWIQGLASGHHPYTKDDLKRAVYGTVRPSLGLETKRAIEEAQRLVQDLSVLETWFPNGFGALARDVRNW
jgi:hypothetical protein